MVKMDKDKQRCSTTKYLIITILENKRKNNKTREKGFFMPCKQGVVGSTPTISTLKIKGLQNIL
jgi:hypothetical protein